MFAWGAWGNWVNGVTVKMAPRPEPTAVLSMLQPRWHSCPTDLEQTKQILKPVVKHQVVLMIMAIMVIMVMEIMVATVATE